MGDVVARMMVRDEAVRAVAHPAHRPAGQLRRPQRHDVFGEDAGLEAEAAADIGRHDAQPVGFDAEHARGVGAQRMRNLRPDVQRIALGLGVVFGARAPRLHRIRRNATDVVVELDHMSGRFEGSLDRRAVAEVVFEADIVGRFGPYGGRARLDGPAGLGHRRQRVVVDHDLLRGVARLGQRLGDDRGDAIADMTHDVVHQHRIGRRDHWHARPTLAHRHGRQALELHRGGIGAGQDGDHAGRLFRGVDVDRSDARMRLDRAQHVEMARVRKMDVVGVAAGAAHQTQILGARDRLPDA